MKIGVCIKQVPDTESVIHVTPDQKGVITDGLKFILNPYDEYAVEEALRTKEKLDGETVAITVGPERSAEALRMAMAMGVDRSIHIVENAANDLDPYAAAAMTAKKLADEKFDVIFTGVKAVDDDCSQFTQILAELLHIPHLTYVSKLDMQNTKAIAIRDVEGGTKEEWELPTPCMLAVSKGINEPRYASLPGIMKAKKKPIDVVALASLGFADGYKTIACRLVATSFAIPQARKAGEKIDGSDPVVAAAKIVEFMQKEAKIV